MSCPLSSWSWLCVTAAVLSGTPSLARSWRVPWYFDCRHSSEWTTFRKVLEKAQGTYDDALFWWAHTLLEKTEPIFLKVQSTKHLYHLCDPNETVDPSLFFAPRGDGEESVFSAVGGTNDWTQEERDRRSFIVRDFCYFGYMAAAAYRTRLVNDGIPGVLEGREHAMSLLRALVTSRSNAVDFLDSSGWPTSHADVLRHLYPPLGPRRLSDEVVELAAEDTLRPAEQVLSRLWPSPASKRGQGTMHGASGKEGHRRHRHVVSAIGYHTTLMLEVVALWTEFLDDRFKLEVAGHILEPGAGDTSEVRRLSLCRDFRGGEFCAWDARLLDLNRRHVHRGRLPLSQLPSPRIVDPPAFVQEFAAAFGRGPAYRDDPSSKAGQLDLRIDSADLHLCTEPAFLCSALSRAFPGRPVVGYFANPLMSYIPAAHAPAWLAEFGALARGGSSNPFLAVASTRFLAEQMRSQTGATVLAVRPLAPYLEPPRGVPKHRPSEVVVVRQPSIFWHNTCILNSLVRMNIEELALAHADGGGLGIPVPGLSFAASEELTDGASEVLATYEASVIFPYDVSQMRLYELYALAVPIFLPARQQLPSYIYRGMTTIDDFNHTLPGARLAFGMGSAASGPGTRAPHFQYDPFDRNNWNAAAAWTELTHWAALPHLVHCDGAADMLSRLARDDLRPVRAGMRRQQERDLVRNANFWSIVLMRLL